MNIIINNKEEMSSPTNSIFIKIPEPCFFHNTGGCYFSDGTPKSSKDCNFLHISVDYPVEKPQHLKIPCIYYHLQKNCTNEYCKYGHSELSENRWKRTFDCEYPGQYYALKCKWIRHQNNPNSNETNITSSSKIISKEPLTEDKIEKILRNSSIGDYFKKDIYTA